MAKHDAVLTLCLIFKPFGNGVVTSYAPQTGGTLNIWALGRMLSTQSRCQPLCTFNSRGGQGDVIDFCLRIIDNGNSDFRILTLLLFFDLIQYCASLLNQAVDAWDNRSFDLIGSGSSCRIN